MIDYLENIKDLCLDINKSIKIMEVCGGHTNTIMKYNIRDVLPSNIKLISGPGCPVCVTCQEDIDSIIALALAGIKIAIYGDMLYVRGSVISLKDTIEKGANIKIIYSTNELTDLDKDRVFLGIGFETTIPMTAYLLSKGFCVFSSHKLMLPAMKLIVEKNEIDGYILPGHVSCITGSEIFEKLEIAQVVSGFEKDEILRGIYKLVNLIKENKKELINDYDLVVSKKGNLIAKKSIDKYFKVSDSNWRGLGVIKNSGLEPKDDNLNAKIKYAYLLKDIKSFENKNCICGEVIRGDREPYECKLFGISCIPKNPIGACMVSNEGACNIAYKYKNLK
ncbi:MAG: hydrogenase formation protein HypD [Nanoarchaeota archaeon]